MNLFARVYTHISANILGVRLKPRVIQLPITNKCNSKCTTCNIWKMKNKQEVNAKKLQKVLQDPYFSKVESVGINGGEPSLHKDFIKVCEAVLSLKALKNIYIISNGLVSKLLVENLLAVKSICAKKEVKLHLTISLDGVDKIHDETRGVPDGFKRTINTIQIIKANIDSYCDTFDLGYTISKRNAGNMVLAKELAASLGVDIYFHLAVPNKRIHTFDSEDYSVSRDRKAFFLAREFFYSEFIDNLSIKKQLKSFINYYYLRRHNGKERIALCNYLKRDVTIDESLNLYLCATASEKVGDLTEHSITEYVKCGALDKQFKQIKRECSTCIHYAFAPTFKGTYLFIKEKYAKVNLLIYLLRSRLYLL